MVSQMILKVYPVHLSLLGELLEYGAEGVGDDQDHDHQPNHQDQQSRKDVPDVLEMSNFHPGSNFSEWKVTFKVIPLYQGSFTSSCIAACNGKCEKRKR